MFMLKQELSKNLIKISRNNFLIHTNFLSMTLISLFCCFEKVFTLINIWIAGKNSIRFYYMKNKMFTVT